MFRKIVEKAYNKNNSSIETVGVFIDSVELFEESYQFCKEKGLKLQPLYFEVDESIWALSNEFFFHANKYIVNEPILYFNIEFYQAVELISDRVDLVYYDGQLL